MRINKDNIYLILSSSKYFNNNIFDDYMENDFTLHTTCKINHNELKNDVESYIISRNGRHCGISVFKHNDGNLFVHFTYWFVDDLGEYVIKTTRYVLPKDRHDEFNHFTMISDIEKKRIDCYINFENVGSIKYTGMKPYSYIGSYFWFGCASMMSEEKYKNDGDFDFKLSFLTKNKIEIPSLIDIVINYETKYIKPKGSLYILNDELMNMYEFGFFCDFKNSSIYKIWNLVNNGIYPVRYFENNTQY